MYGMTDKDVTTKKFPKSNLLKHEAQDISYKARNDFFTWVLARRRSTRSETSP